MEHLALTLATPEENLALDEALLEEAERGESGEILRLWEPRQTMVVLGRSSVIEAEVNVDACRKQGVPVLRRSSGGAAIVSGPGCLMYAVVLSYQTRPELRPIDHAHHFVLETIGQELNRRRPGVQREGVSDLTFEGRKFSGNSLRCKRRFLLYHGTLLYDFPLEQIGQLLKMPPRQPNYREGRDHSQFLGNLPLLPTMLCQTLCNAWRASVARATWPEAIVSRLASEIRQRT